MTNKTKRNIALTLVVLGAATFVGLAVSKKFFGAEHPMWEYIAAPLLTFIFAAFYRNFSLATKEDQKYGPTK